MIRNLKVFGGGPGSDHVLADRVRESLGRVASRVPTSDLAELEKTLQAAADRVGAGAVLVAVVATPAPVRHPAVIELPRESVAEADNYTLDALVARGLAERITDIGAFRESTFDVLVRWGFGPYAACGVARLVKDFL